MKNNKIKKILIVVLSLIFTMLPINSAMAMETQSYSEPSILESGVISSSVAARTEWESRGPGGRHDITLGTHNETQYILAQFTSDTWVQYRDKNWGLVWEGSFGSGKVHTLMCTSSVFTISIYLPSEGFVTFKR